MNEKDYFSYILALASIILAVIGIVSEEYKTFTLIIGSLGLGVSIIIIKINEYIRKINKNIKEVDELKKELNYFKNFQELKKEIISLKNEINKIKK